MIYLTFNEYPSGVFKSQVIDRINRLDKNAEHIHIVSFISLRNFFKKRNQFKDYRKYVKNIYVIPMFPYQLFWKVNILTLFL